MKRLLFTSVLSSLFIISCGYVASQQEMINRKNAFLNGLPGDVAEQFDIRSDEYGPQIAAWKTEADEWIAATLAKEEQRTEELLQTPEAQASPELRQNIILTNRFYERENPEALMAEVREYTDEIAVDLAAAMENDAAVKAHVEQIKSDEAIVLFTTEEVTFYFMWNYVLTLDRPRRFQ